MAGGTGGHVFPGLALARRAAREVPRGRVARHRARSRVARDPRRGHPDRAALDRRAARQGCAHLARGAVSPERRSRAGAARSCGATVRSWSWDSAALSPGPAGSPRGWRAARSSSTSRTRSRASPTAVSRTWRGGCSKPFPGSFGREVHARAIGNPVRRDISQVPPPARALRRPDGAGAAAGARRQSGCRAAQCGRAVCAGAAGRAARLRRAPSSRRALARGRPRELRRRPVCARDVRPFIEDMAEAYGWADLVICRSGALTVSELAAAGVGAVLVPFPAAVDDHQTHNARYPGACRRGGADRRP